MDVGRVGVWGTGTWLDESRRDEAKDVAAELDDLGYGSLWLSAGFGEGVPTVFGDLLDATRRLAVASGILSIWHSTPQQTADGFERLEQRHPGRFLLGLGASHAPRVEQAGERYNRPYSRMVGYLDQLDAQQAVVPVERRVLAALGPRMLRLAAERAAGAHPYFVPVEHTAQARETLGDGPLLVTEQAVVLETDPDRARRVARRHTTGYLGLPNYTNNLRRLGYGDDDIAGAGSDRLVDAVVAWGTPDQVADRVRAHHDAGADCVLVQVLTDGAARFPRQEYRELANVLL
ncbi:MAG: LLM class F420-dependent oxidoreductase [Actinomycetes bacterium]